MNKTELIHRDNWLSDHFACDVFNLNIEDINALPGFQQTFKEQFSGKRCFIYSKLDTTQLSLLEGLTRLGFRLVSTTVAFEKPISSSDVVTNVSVREAREDDKQAIASIASSAFKYSRFHTDPYIPSELANKIKASWVSNYFTKQRGDSMLVAELNGVVAGFLQLIFSANDTLVIDLIAASAQFQKQGVCSSLIKHAQNIHSGFSQVKVSTQVSNVPSIRLYEKLGFLFNQSQYVLHYHSEI